MLKIFRAGGCICPYRGDCPLPPGSYACGRARTANLGYSFVVRSELVITFDISKTGGGAAVAGWVDGDWSVVGGILDGQDGTEKLV